VLAADADGAWFVAGGTANNRAVLAHVAVGQLGKREYPLRVTPTGVAASGSAVWVVGHNRHEDEVLRVDPAGGRVTVEMRLATSARIDSIAYGYGAVWVMSSATATLYRIDPRTTRVTSLEVAHSRAARPEILPRGGDLWVRAVDGTTYSIQPWPLAAHFMEYDGPPGWEENLGDLGSLWWYDWPTGTVYRQELARGPILRIRVTHTLPNAGGPCLTSMTIGSASLWITVAPSHRSICRR
jgi:hypothetical protein